MCCFVCSVCLGRAGGTRVDVSCADLYEDELYLLGDAGGTGTDAPCAVRLCCSCEKVSLVARRCRRC